MTANGYYNQIRHDVLSHVPTDVRRVLSTGCGEGCTEKQLVGRGVHVTGIELNPEAAAIAASVGINVVCGDACGIGPGVAGSSYDCLLYADVLEHIADPQSVILHHMRFLAPNGVVIVSVPNFRHYSVLFQLFLLGRVRYCDAGILDRTHVRITTRRLVQDWFAKCDVATTRIDYRFNRRRDSFLSFLSCGLLNEFLATQVIVVGALKGMRPHSALDPNCETRTVPFAQI